MRNEIEALKEIRDRISYFCSRTDGKYDPPWAQEVIGIIDDVLIMPYRRCKRFGAPFYVEVGTSIVAIRCASNHDVVWRADHSVHGKSTVDWAESVCTRMNQEAHKSERGDAAKLREALKLCVDEMCDRCRELAVARGNPMPCLSGCEPVRKAKAALAAPARNCDRFKTAAEAIDAYQDLTGDQLATDSGMKEWVEFAVWLLATATEKEGGAK